MTAAMFRDRLERAGIDLVTPPDEDMCFVYEVYFGELVNGVVRDETRTAGIPLLNTARIQVEAGLDWLVGG